jgi:uncharacterized coiled-coil DUF342 family protein
MMENSKENLSNEELAKEYEKIIKEFYNKKTTCKYENDVFKFITTSKKLLKCIATDLSRATKMAKRSLEIKNAKYENGKYSFEATIA